jgi:hypothetical protein
VGSGITVIGTPTYSGATTGASGIFSGGVGSGIGIESGLIMTTGLAASAVGPNVDDSFSGPGITSTLSFNFTTSGGDLFFNYVFASEEFNEYANSPFNDSFQFLLDGVNIALIPGTSIPVTINNVNGTDTPALFNSNDPTDGTPTPYDLQYDGFTDVFTAKALGIGSGTHNITLTISDVGDSNWDSAVFIQANSFSDTPTTVPEGGSVLWVAAMGMIIAGRLFRRPIRCLA